MLLSDQIEFSVPDPPEASGHLLVLLHLTLERSLCASRRSPLFTATSRSCSFPMTAERDTQLSRRPNLRFVSRRRSFRRALPYIPQRAAEPWPWKCSEQRRAQRHGELRTLSRTEPEPCQSAAPFFSSWLRVAGLLGLRLQSDWKRLRCESGWHGEILSAWRRSNGPAFEWKNTKLQDVKNKKNKMKCMTTIKLFRLHFPGEGWAEIILLTTVCLQNMDLQFLWPYFR